ncbi:MAG: hypothetical protein V2A79_09935 [Planctomycetota bacterium]
MKNYTASPRLVLALLLAALLWTVARGEVQNRCANIAAMPIKSVMSVACSADGATLYVTADNSVWRSRDYGDNWDVILRSR